MITLADINQIIAEALMLVIRMALPMLLTSMIIGLVVSIFQTVTSIQEQTLTFVPKIIAVFSGLILLGYWMLSTITEYIQELWSDFGQYIK